MLVHAACCESRRRGVSQGHLVTSRSLSAAWTPLPPTALTPTGSHATALLLLQGVTERGPCTFLSSAPRVPPGGGFLLESCVRNEPPRPGPSGLVATLPI